MNKKLKLPLFERIIFSQEETTTGLLSPEEQYIGSVKNNIEEILKTRNANLNLNPEIRYSAPFFGIDSLDSNNITPSLIDRLTTKIREAIEHFEPRIQEVNVEYLIEENGTAVLNVSFLITELDKKDIFNYVINKEK